ncbi:MAG: hypothetical protein M1818_005007 [Claussenomyces sp. TS43310]|nr:MAG: hypothetical protein M1818_005007 [Claussenomyces sp. TS43310]
MADSKSTHPTPAHILESFYPAGINPKHDGDRYRSAPPEKRRWVKTGIELYEGEAYVSTVACDAWADWSLFQTGITASGTGGEKEVTLEMERKGRDATLWVYVVDGEKRAPVRDVTWLASEEEGDGEERVVWVGVYAATPTLPKEGKREQLEVGFRGLRYGFRK